MFEGKGIAGLEGSQVRVAFQSDYLQAIRSVYGDITAGTLYVLTSVDEHGVTLAVGSNASDRNATLLFAPWNAFAALIPVSRLQAQQGAA